MPSQTEKNGRLPQRSGRHSYLPVVIIILSLIAVLGGGLLVMAWFMGDRAQYGWGQGIGVIRIEGIISDSTPTVKALTRFRRSKKVKAIIIRVDSPGGGVAATQEIYQEIRRTKKTKKIVISMGSLAASGGLYVAAPADKIVANQATVTGSIGVIMHLVNLEQLLGKVGVNPMVIKSGKFKDIGSGTRPMTEEERQLLQSLVEELHQQFITDLARGRGLEVDKVRAMADGRIFTGAEARKLGLVDQLGNFEDAVELAGKLAGLGPRPKLIHIPEKKRWWLTDLLDTANPLDKLLPSWTRQPLSFQYLYLPGV